MTGAGTRNESAIRNANVPEEILSPWAIVTLRHAGH